MSLLPRSAGLAPYVVVPRRCRTGHSAFPAHECVAGLPLGWDRRPSAAARTKRQGNGRHQLGKLGFLRGSCFADLRRSGVGALVASGAGPRCSPRFPAGSGTRMARSLRLERPLAKLDPEAPEPQPTTVSHDGGSADRPGTRMPRCTPTGLSHAIRPSTRASPDGGSARPSTRIQLRRAGGRASLVAWNVFRDRSRGSSGACPWRGRVQLYATWPRASP